MSFWCSEQPRVLRIDQVYFQNFELSKLIGGMFFPSREDKDVCQDGPDNQIVLTLPHLVTPGYLFLSDDR